MNQTEYHENLTKGFKTLGSRFDSFFIRSKLDLIKDNMALVLESQMTKRVIVKKNLKVRGVRVITRTRRDVNVLLVYRREC